MRLALDIGTTSIGWWLYRTDNKTIISVIDSGVRIFSDGREPSRGNKSGKSLAVNRREARGTRRRRDRYLRRRTSLMKKLSDSGLMPKDPEEAKKLQFEDPYKLRAEGLEKKLELTQLGRAFFHLNQRRGFKSNRKTDRGDNDSGKIKEATARLDQAMMAEGDRTYGQFLHMRREKQEDPRLKPSVRTRLTLAARAGGEKEEAGYDFYPDRRHLEEEFNKLWEKQAEYHVDILTDDLRATLFETIFFQRPLKEPKVGLCLLTDEKRLAKAHPLTQRRVLYETVNNLRITADGKKKRALTIEERDKIIHALDNKKPAKKLKSMVIKLPALAKEIKLSADEQFSLETGMRDSIACDPVRASLSHPERFGPRWSTLDMPAQWDVVQRIRTVQSEKQFDELVQWLQDTHKLDEENARQTANAPLPEGYARLGETATSQILDALQNEVDEEGQPLTYDKAVKACGWHHSDNRTDEDLDFLPYYGEILDRHVIPGSLDRRIHDPVKQAAEYYGRITNPTVHIGMNQIRRLVNKIIKTHGKPEDIVLELARDLKQSEKQKIQIEKINKENRKAAEERSKQLVDLKQQDTGANRALLRLYEELGPAIGPRCCPYTGETINVHMLFNGECDIDHILPYSRTLDNSFANRTLCLRKANKEKRNKTPWEQWGNTSQWDKIAENLKNLPDNKKWRFAPDAMERFEGENDFLDRSLVDTQYLSRLATTYLSTLYPEGSHVWVVPGRMTEMLRRHWGLNNLLPDRDRKGKKNRTDHRHHAIDAAVIGATDRALLQRIQKAAGRDEGDGKSAEDVARSIEKPWKEFREDVKRQLEKIIVSHRADHGRIDKEAKRNGLDSTAGQLHNDTAYGIVDNDHVVSRTAFVDLKPGDIDFTTRGKNLRDPYLRKKLLEWTKGKEGKAFEQALREFSAQEGPYHGIRHVRLIESLQKSARVEIADQKGKPFKAYKGDSNYCYEIWKMPDGRLTPQVITTFEAHGDEGVRRPHPAAKRLLKVFKRDMVAIERDGKTIVCYVQAMTLGNGLKLAPHNEANADARDRDKDDPFSFFRMSANSLIKAKIRRIGVDEMGRVKDANKR